MMQPKSSIVNIGPAEQRKRVIFGWVSLAFAVGLWIALWILGVNAFWRLLTFPFSLAGALGLLQAREKT